MDGKYLLDKNIVIPFLAGDSRIQHKIRQVAEVFIPVIVIGELLYGAHKSARRAENLARIEEFMAHTVIVACDIDTARQYGEIKAQLRKAGQPIPENDLWIAAIALQYECTVASRDGHFASIPGLALEVW